MSIITELLTRVKAVEAGLTGGTLIGEVVSQHDSDIMELQRIQLLEGKASSGEDLRPYYSEDLKPSGYFRSTESAERYARWKTQLSYPYNVERNADAPNLYVNGRFHSELGAEYGADSMKIDGQTEYAQKIVLKYGLESFGLTGENWSKIFRERGGLGELINKLKDILYE